MLKLASKLRDWFTTLNLGQKLGLFLGVVCMMLLGGSIVAQLVDPPKTPLTLEQIYGEPGLPRPDAGP